MMDDLRQQVMVNQFVLAAGCDRETAARCLAQAEWQFQTALSVYFQEVAVPKNPTSGFPLLPPTNTPATPPSFPEALNMFSNLTTSEGASPRPSFGLRPRPTLSPPARGPVSVMAVNSGSSNMDGVSGGGEDFLQFPMGPPMDWGMQQQQQQQEQQQQQQQQQSLSMAQSSLTITSNDDASFLMSPENSAPGNTQQHNPTTTTAETIMDRY